MALTSSIPLLHSSGGLLWLAAVFPGKQRILLVVLQVFLLRVAGPAACCWLTVSCMIWQFFTFCVCLSIISCKNTCSRIGSPHPCPPGWLEITGRNVKPKTKATARWILSQVELTPLDHLTLSPPNQGTEGAVFPCCFPCKCLCLERCVLIVLWIILRAAGSSWLPAQLVHKQPLPYSWEHPFLGITAAYSQSHPWGAGYGVRPGLVGFSWLSTQNSPGMGMLQPRCWNETFLLGIVLVPSQILLSSRVSLCHEMLHRDWEFVCV